MTTTDETGSTGSTVLEAAVTSTDPVVLAKVWGFGGMTSVLLGAVAGLLVGFGTVMGSKDDLARTVRVADDLTVGESAGVLRIDPA